MGRSIIFLASLLLLSSFGMGQSNYYQAEGERIDLFLNKKSVLVYVDTIAYADGIFKHSSLEKIEVSPQLIPSNYFVLSFPEDINTDLTLEISSHLFHPHMLSHANFGFKTVDGMELWLSKRLAFLPNSTYSQVAMDAILSLYPGATLDTTDLNIRVVEVEEPRQSLEISQRLAATNMFHWVHPDFFAPMEPMNDPLYADQFYLDNTGQVVDGAAGTANIDINAPEAWAILTSNRQVVVGVVDNGVEAHLDLQDTLGVSRMLTGYSAYNLTVAGLPYLNIEMHGQACAGIIAALHGNSSGIRGIAQDALVLPIYFPLVVTPTNVVEVANGIIWGYQNGAEVMNNSYGYPSCLNNPFPVLTNAIDSALINGRGGLGTIMVFAAGNDTGCVRFPGNLSRTLTAGAVDKNGNLSTYSNTGSAIDVVAPSSANVNAQGVRVTDRMGANGSNFVGATDITDINYSRQFGGTSSATAQVSGVAALMLKEAPFLTADSIYAIIKQTAIDMGVAGYDTLYGHGRLNALAAVQAAKGTLLPVVWLGLEAESNSNGVKLKWEATQEDGSHFEVWRNGQYQGELRAGDTREYTFLDEAPLDGIARYQVIWVGLDGSRNSSPLVEVSHESGGQIRIQQQGAAWRLTGLSIPDGPGRLQIRDLGGKLVHEKSIEVKGSRFYLEIPSSTFAKGLYFVEFKDAVGASQRLKVVNP